MIGHSSVLNYAVTAYVTPSGVVQIMAVAYDVETGGDRQRATVRFEYSAVGETTVTKPDWAVGVTPTPDGPAE